MQFFLKKTLPKVASYHGCYNLIISKTIRRADFVLEAPKAVLRVFLANHNVAMVTFCVTEMMTTFFDTMVVA